MKKPNREAAYTSKLKLYDSEEEEEEDYESSSSEGEDGIERELADVTFGELQKAKSDGSHSVFLKQSEEKKGKRANKNRPTEVSCKKPVGRFREVVQAPKKIVRDPRFESLCGNLDVDGFRTRYNFLFENDLPAEKEELRKQLKKSHDPKVVEELTNHISWIDKQMKYDKSKHTEAAILAEHKKKERESVKQGKRPFYLKKSDIKKKRLVEKYKELKSSGKLGTFVEKKRRKNAKKDHKYMPYRRPNEDGQQS